MVQGQENSKELCLNLLYADTEEEVIRILEQEEYWDDPSVWRAFGDKKDNFSTMGNQSSSAEAALVEKLVNSVDAVLMGECLSAGVLPSSANAPRSIPEAVALFFFGDGSKADSLGNISDWHDRKRRELSQRITLAATGSRSRPSFTIVDDGEGQTPKMMPHTLLSLDKQNKINVHFVQGKFNMGGTGALRFCGRENLQLIISRRSPKIELLPTDDDSVQQWGFTIVRRENPTEDKKVSTYKYLAPESGEVLRFHSDYLHLFPSANEAYSRSTPWGTAIKLYEYSLKGKSHILLSDGLLYRLDILLPRIALPVRLHECRDYKGAAGSFDTTLNGLGVRLSDDRGQNLEEGFPTSSSFTVNGEPMTASVYAFRRGKADTYRKDEGVIFSVNGQTHGHLHRNFFARKSVRMNRLVDSILVIVDCSNISGRSREDLFMNSRDRMERGEFLREIEKELESIVRENQLLRDLSESRRREDIASKLQDSKPFQDVLKSILIKSPSLASLLSGKGSLPNPFKPKSTNRLPFESKTHPTYFRFRDEDYGHKLYKETPLNARSRIIFETDVENEYFTREKYGGKFSIQCLDGNLQNGALPNHRLNLNNGVATLNLNLPDAVAVGDTVHFEATVHDETLIEPFVNSFTITVKPEHKTKGGKRIKPDSPTMPQGLSFPTLIEVHEEEWDSRGFDKDSALKVIPESDGGDDTSSSYTFYINMANIFLNSELKATKENTEILKSRWKFGMALIGMALLRDLEEEEKEGDKERENEVVGDDESSLTPADQVFRSTAAIAPVLLPLIEHLGGLSEDELTV